MIEKTIKIGNVDCKMRTSSSMLRLYRDSFNRDMLKDIQVLTKDNTDTRIIENVAWTLNKLGDSSQPNDIYVWLSQFEGALDVINAGEEIIKMVSDEFSSQLTSKKK